MPSGKGPSLSYRRIRAPKADGELVLEPTWSKCLLHPTQNRALFDSYDFDLGGSSIQELRQQMRAELLALATAHSVDYAGSVLRQDLQELSHDDLVVMSGHQPRLFHPGVWAKNFATAGIAERVHGIAVHVVIDNDLMRSQSIRLPTESIVSPAVVSEAFDTYAAPMPFEQRNVQDFATFRTFADRVSQGIKPLVANPLVNDLWPQVLAAVDRGKSIGHAFAEARHVLELQYGLRSIEVPLSQLCDSQAFRRFALHLLTHGEAVTMSYNTRLAEYRALHGLRNSAQPLPDLAVKGEWTEAPFWIWTKSDPTRQSLWWSRSGADVLLTNAQRTKRWTLNNALRTNDDGLDRLNSLCEDEFYLRPRALTNTMFLRLLCCDAFVHGIGGAKYDQVTDLLMFDLFGILPPKFIALSQTTLLPLDAELVSQDDYNENKRILREMYFHPERFLDKTLRNSPKVSSLEKNKSKWIETRLERGQRLERHQAINAANAELREYLQEKTEKRKKILNRLEAGLRASQVLGSREWSFCLFPDTFLKTRLLELRATNP